MNPEYLTHLESLPTLSVGQTADLKIDGPAGRIWVSRCPEEGEPPVMYETLADGRWIDVTHAEHSEEHRARLECPNRHHHFTGSFCVECGGWG